MTRLFEIYKADCAAATEKIKGMTTEELFAALDSTMQIDVFHMSGMEWAGMRDMKLYRALLREIRGRCSGNLGDLPAPTTEKTPADDACKVYECCDEDTAMLLERFVGTLGVVSKRLRAYRKQAGITQEMLAEKAGLHSTYIGQVERGEKNLTLSSLDKILGALGVSFAELFERIGESSETPAGKCYELIRKHPLAQQEALYRILCEIENVL